jgi:hypothetical protein
VEKSATVWAYLLKKGTAVDAESAATYGSKKLKAPEQEEESEEEESEEGHEEQVSEPAGPSYANAEILVHVSADDELTCPHVVRGERESDGAALNRLVSALVAGGKSCELAWRLFASLFFDGRKNGFYAFRWTPRAPAIKGASAAAEANRKHHKQLEGNPLVWLEEWFGVKQVGQTKHAWMSFEALFRAAEDEAPDIEKPNINKKFLEGLQRLNQDLLAHNHLMPKE